MGEEKAPARDRAVRKADVLTRLEQDVDAWVSTAGADGLPYLMPLSFVWFGERLVMTTRAANPTARNVRANGRAYVSLGHTRDVVLIEAEAESVPSGELPAAVGEAFVGKFTWDVRADPAYAFLLFRPVSVRAWREVNELPERELMRDGVWLV
ncbi:pyridoxamine 5'-phosphate oxidase family protein [Streptomyces avicenniae]|uniref:pyridoxamine 5'-phosphate oxidase family protein n=1 Tax=Streptomyces avicenniae TaxID=500153 RepID=UPI0006994A1C|nr:pyridoxamine 5'-phosphate oxidase family protein [Streptomyces avicenniae]